MSETSFGIEFFKGLHPFKKEASESFIVENKNGLSREHIEKFTHAYKRLEDAGVVSMMQDFIREHSKPQNKPFAGIELLRRDDGVQGEGYYVFFDRNDVKVPATPDIQQGPTVKVSKHGLLLKNQQIAKGVKLVRYADGVSEVSAYRGSTKDGDMNTIEDGGRWVVIDGELSDKEKIHEAAVKSTPYFIVEAKNSCIIKNPAPENTSSQKHADKVTLKP